jgi:predicted transcriptional regulator
MRYISCESPPKTKTRDIRRFVMGPRARPETMRRKPILMPPDMIKKVDKIASDKNVSFAEVVRAAVDAFDGDLSIGDKALLEALADTMIGTTQEVIKKIDEVGKRLDDTHAKLGSK